MTPHEEQVAAFKLMVRDLLAAATAYADHAALEDPFVEQVRKCRDVVVRQVRHDLSGVSGATPPERPALRLVTS
jgi:hypothetical protein